MKQFLGMAENKVVGFQVTYGLTSARKALAHFLLDKDRSEACAPYPLGSYAFSPWPIPDL